MKLNQQFYILSDTHFGHKNICKYEERPSNYAEIIVERWNKTVKKNDNILFLGDLALTDKTNAMKWCHQLQGNKFMIRGNHDGKSETWYKDCGFTTVEPIFRRFKDKYEKYITVLFTHEPVQNLPKGWFNIHGHIHLGRHRDHPFITPYHYNACVEVLDYTPKPLWEILDELRERVK